MLELHNRKIIVNNDFDGCACANIMVSLFNATVAGFSNSKDAVYLVDGNELTDDLLFIDMFTPYYDCVDQHIHPREFPRNLSPNSSRQVFAFTDYRHKFPFSTYFWLLAIASSLGIRVDDFIPSKIELSDNRDYVKKDIVYRADDSLLNCCKYSSNCKDWAGYLLKYSGNNRKLKDTLDFMLATNEDDVLKWKAALTRYFKNNYNIDGEELSNIDDPLSKTFLARFNINFDKVTKVIRLRHERIVLKTKNEFEELYDRLGRNLFSFAFTFSTKNPNKPNFSYSTIGI